MSVFRNICADAHSIAKHIIIIHMSHIPYVFLDVETTGMSPRTGGRIIEIGALRMENYKVVAKMNTFIYPETDIPYFITGITGITDSHVASAPLFHEIIDELDRITKDAIFVAHNVNFDYTFIQEEYRKLEKEFIRSRLCTVQLSRALHPNEKGHSLGKIIERYGYTVSNRHRAYDDAEVLYQLFIDMHKQDSVALKTHIDRLLR